MPTGSCVRQWYAGSGSQQQIRIKSFLAKYKPDDILQQEAIAAATAALDSTMKLMEQLLAKLPASELERPAFVSVPADQFEGFEDLVATSGMLVKPNPSFPRAAAGSTVPTLFIAYCVFDSDGSAAPGAGEDWVALFRPGKLRQLLK